MNNIVIGIDPGAKYTAVSVINPDAPLEERVIQSSVYVRPDEMPEVTWAVHVTNKIMNDVITNYPLAKIGIEGVTTPQSHYNGRLALMNPKNTIKLAIVVGAIAMALPKAAIIRPGKNGSQETYPKVLNGQRPKTLPGINEKAGTRNHERSAYDVAMLTEKKLKEGYILDHIKTIFD